MAIIRFQVDTDKQIARAILKQGSLSRKELVSRANLAGIQYRALGNRIIAQKGYKSPGSPFEGKEHVDAGQEGEGLDRSVLDKKSFNVRVVGDHLEIRVDAPAAEFVETGNAPGVSDKKMAIRVKPASVRKGKGKRGKPRYTLSSGTRIRKFEGKYYLFARRAKPANGYHLLEKAVRTAFRSRR